jgi:hypothetical protein
MPRPKHTAKWNAIRLGGGWEYRGFIITQDYSTKRWVAVPDSQSAEPVFWAQTLRSAKARIDDHIPFRAETDHAQD